MAGKKEVWKKIKFGFRVIITNRDITSKKLRWAKLLHYIGYPTTHATEEGTKLNYPEVLIVNSIGGWGDDCRTYKSLKNQ